MSTECDLNMKMNFSVNVFSNIKGLTFKGTPKYTTDNLYICYQYKNSAAYTTCLQDIWNRLFGTTVNKY